MQSNLTYIIYRSADVNCRDNKKTTPVMMASGKSGNAKTVQILLRNEADVMLTDREDCTALHVATTEDNVDAVKVCRVKITNGFPLFISI